MTGVELNKAISKTTLYTVIWVLMVIAVFEGASWWALTTLNSRFVQDYDQAALAAIADQPELVARYKDLFFDPRLGWNYKPHRHFSQDGATYHIDAKGARQNPTPFKNVVISTYGDSFTFCYQIEDEVTWQKSLSQLTHSDVVNWGVNGYGTDQAVLKFQQNLEQGRDPASVVILGVYPENINRIMNMYRPFYIASDVHLMGFKPMYVKTNGSETSNDPAAYRLLPSPLQSVTPQGIEQAYQTAKTYDFWYDYFRAYDRYPARFPYTVQLLGVIINQIQTADAPLKLMQYENPQATQKMDFLIRSFVALAAEHHKYPVVLVLSGHDVYSWRYWTKLAQQYPAEQATFMMLDEMMTDEDQALFEQEKQQYHIGHFTPEYNKRVAQRLYERLQTLPVPITATP